MGGKQARTRKQIHFCTAVLLMSLMVTGCSLLSFNWTEDRLKRDDPHVHLASGKKMFGNGDFAGASRELEKAYSSASGTFIAEEALLYLGSVNADPANPRRDHGKAVMYLKRLSDSYPRSPFTEQARIMQTIIRENDESSRTIERLKAIIEASKKVDREIEEKRRETTGK